MKTPEFITFTGIDDRADLTRASRLAEIYPIEWGVLFSKNNQDARYPCKQAVEEILWIDGAVSAHICGKWSKDIAVDSMRVEQIPLERFHRTQLNGVNVSSYDSKRLKTLYGVDAISQTTFTDLSCHDHEVLYLFDRSGGKGKLPVSIPMLGDYFLGYAGGMGPDTVIEYLSRIHGDGEFWIDMESNVRTDGWFDLDKVERVCELVYGQ